MRQNSLHHSSRLQENTMKILAIDLKFSSGLGQDSETYWLCIFLTFGVLELVIILNNFRLEKIM